MHSIESRVVIGPSNMLFAGVYMSTFEPGNLRAGAAVKTGLNMVNTKLSPKRYFYFFFLLPNTDSAGLTLVKRWWSS